MTEKESAEDQRASEDKISIGKSNLKLRVETTSVLVNTVALKSNHLYFL